MESGLFWRETVTALHEAEGEGVSLRHILADACAMELVRDPKQFDVILAGNLFGDILSDAAAMLSNDSNEDAHLLVVALGTSNAKVNRQSGHIPP